MIGPFMLETLRDLEIPKKRAVIATAVVIVAGIAYLVYETSRMAPPLLPGYPGDAFFPRLVLGFTALFGAVVIAMRLMPSMKAHVEGADDSFRFDPVETAVTSLLVLAYMLLMEPLGFEISTTVFMFLLLWPRMLMPLVKGLAVAAAGSVVTMLIIYAAFVIGLKVSMPVSYLPAYWNF